MAIDLKARLAAAKTGAKPAPTAPKAVAARGTTAPSRSPFRGLGDAKVTERLPKLGEGAEFSDHHVVISKVKFHGGREQDYFIAETGILSGTLHEPGDERGWSCPIKSESMGNIKSFLLACAPLFPDELAALLSEAEEQGTAEEKEAAWIAVADWACGEENPIEGFEMKVNSALRESKKNPGKFYLVHTFKAAA